MRSAARRSARRTLRWRRLRALLAAGVVLGIGTAATLAAWNDTEHTSATFQAGRFGIVGSIGGGPFGEHASAEAAAVLDFQVAPTALAPGATTYALFSVQTLNPSLAGSVQLAAGDDNTDGLGQHLTYGVRVVDGTTCDASTFDGSTTTVVAPGSPLGQDAATPQTVEANAGSAVRYCFAVTLRADAPNEAQGMTVTPTWQFVATSS